MISIHRSKLGKRLLIPFLIALSLIVPLSGAVGVVPTAAAVQTPVFPLPPLTDAFKASALPNVLVIGTGGTISGQANDGDPTNLQTYKSGTYKIEDMVAQLPRKDKISDVSTYQFGNKGSGSYSIGDLYDLSLTVDQALQTYDGVVVTTGTDTMEDIAYFLDLTVRSGKPVVVTGAMRPWDVIGTDAPANLYNAIKLAGSNKTQWYGTVVMLNDVIQAARDVTKLNAQRLDTFGTPIFGALGYIDQDNISLYRLNDRALKAGRPEWATPFDLSKIQKTDLPMVEIAYAYQDAGGGGINGLVADGAKGIVTAGTGAGGISSKMSAARAEAIKKGVIFVTTTRTGSGTMYPSDTDGIIAGDSLNPQHARMMLLVALAFSNDFKTVKDWFWQFGRQDIAQDDVSAVGGPVEEPVVLKDIAGHWAMSSIEKAVASGIIRGYTDGTFKPNQSLTRVEFTVMLMNALKLQGDGASLTFKDSNQIGKWAVNGISQAVKAGIVSGYTDGTFKPNTPISRSEMAVIIAKAMKYDLQAGSTTGFKDDAAIPKWAKGSVKATKDHALITGRSGGVFVPNDPATRAEAVTILLKLPAIPIS
ncbi:asparaginase domain-containing protein [Paenibacillus solisilvae]|uniref:asparaginase n=1 Tax=Paenibacillus solisilvae TaxID=2486751 RepID=A0ABW0W1Q6_9BACL